MESGTSNASRRIDGILHSSQVLEDLRNEIVELNNKKFRVPHLAVVIVGNRKDSETYVRKKIQSCQNLGFQSSKYQLVESTTQEELLELIRKLNQDDGVDGILVQLPLPSSFDDKAILESIDSSKDVDGLHPLNLGSLIRYRPDKLKLFGSPEWLHINDYLAPCTAEGVIELLVRSHVAIAGTRVTVLGRSKLVGLPVSILLRQHGAGVVTMCHSKTKDLQSVCAAAEILVVAVGRPNFVKATYVKQNAVVIDVGINAVADNACKNGYRLCGDVDREVEEKCRLLSPVPGGVGPMTVAVLMRNALKARMARVEHPLSKAGSGAAQ